MIYGSTDLRQANLLNTKFREKYPFIDVKLNRLTSDNLYPRVTTEARSGKFLVDILQNNDLGLYFLKKGRFLAYYVSPEDRFFPKTLRTRDTGQQPASMPTSLATTLRNSRATSFLKRGKIF